MESVGGDSSSVKDAYKPFDFAVVVGAQAEWKHRWVFEGQYSVRAIREAYEVTIGGMETVSAASRFSSATGYANAFRPPRARPRISSIFDASCRQLLQKSGRPPPPPPTIGASSLTS